jgi:hypothetical protein
MTQERGVNRLVSLVEKAKSECHSIAGAVRHDLKTIEDAREAGLTWAEISEALGFPDKWREIQRAYSRERRRAKKEKEVVPEKKKMPPAPKEEKNKATRSDSPVSTDGVVTGTKPPDPKEPEPRRNRWREIKY